MARRRARGGLGGRIFAGMVVGAFVCAASVGLAAENRDGVAVIIGNKNYKGQTPAAAFAHNDAEAMKGYVIGRMGFRPGNVIDLRDASKGELERVFGTHETHEGELFDWVRAGRSDVVVFYSGHGVPGLTDRRSYLLPVDGDPGRARITGYPIDLLYANLAKIGARSVVVYLDACFSGGSPAGTLIRAASGLMVRPRQPVAGSGMVVLTAASGDQLASWDEQAGHGLFTKHLLEALEGVADGARYGNGDGQITVHEVKKYLDEEMTYQARRRYSRSQIASVEGAGETVLARVGDGAAAMTGRKGDNDFAELEFWSSIKGGPNPAAFLSYLDRYPNGIFSGLARVKLDGIRRVAAFPPAASRPRGVDEIGPGSAETHTQVAIGTYPGRYRPGETFTDCDDCPEMVIVPSGWFVMGSAPDEDGRSKTEGPRHRVTIAKRFAIGKFEVTFAEWDACTAADGCGGYRPDDYGLGRGRRPVIDVSWADAKSYVAWLSRKTGKHYRLLSESEWEYAARAGTTTSRWWGNDPAGREACRYANVHDAKSKRGNRFGRPPHACDDGHGRAAPVGSYAANPFGLHDVLGNVWEWVEDCWNTGHAGAPNDGAARTSGNCNHRVVRGGSWNYEPRIVRSAYRDGIVTDFRNRDNGFRIARTLY